MIREQGASKEKVKLRKINSKGKYNACRWNDRSSDEMCFHELVVGYDTVRSMKVDFSAKI